MEFELLDPRDVQRILGISRTFTYRLLKSGQLKSLRLGKLYRIRPNDLAGFVLGFGNDSGPSPTSKTGARR